MTFLFTDIEGSTRLWQQDEPAMRAAVARHDDLLRAVITEFGGTVFSAAGDGFAAAFPSAPSAANAAVDAQRRLAAEAWPTAVPVRVRMGLHTGDAQERAGDYFGTVVNRAARVMAVGHGGQVLCSAATASLVEGAVTILDLGEHRLRDLDRPLRVFQVGEGSFPPLRALDAFPSNLPVQLTSFVGRAQDLALVAKALGDVRLVTLTGTGGVGKTRLALQAAAEVVTGFPDGAWLCELAVAADPESMCEVVALALGLAPRQGIALPQAIAEFVSNRHLLLVLDNCEHLLDPVADLVATLIGRCPQLSVLATSREALGVPGEQVIRLRSLAVPDRGANRDELARVDATRLFLDRAESTGTQLELGPGDGQAIIEICRRLDGIPLAIELAAARVVALGPAEIAAHLDERFRLLTGGRRAAMERHHTLRAAVDWSYSLLTDTERHVFDSLGVFPGTFDAAAAQAVAGGDRLEAWDVLDALASLVAKSMLGTDRSVDGSTRYQMLETLRHYARERLDATSRADACRRAHARHYLAAVTEMAIGARTPDEAKWRSRLAVELDNFRAAVGWGLDAGDDADGQLAMSIIGTMYSVGQAGSTGVNAWAEQALDRVDGCDPRYRRLVIACAAVGAYFRGDFALGKQLAGDAASGGVVGSWAPGNVLTPQYIFAGADEIETLIERDLHWLDEAGAAADGRDYLGVRLGAGLMAVENGLVSFAREQVRTAVEDAHRLGSQYFKGEALYAFAFAWWQDEPDEALRALDEGLRIIEDLERAGGGAFASRAQALQAQLHAHVGHPGRAVAALRGAIRKAHADGDRPSMATCLARGAHVMTAAGNPETAATFVGALSGGALAKMHAVPTPERPLHVALLESLRGVLGTDTFENAVRRGAGMTYEDVVVFALQAVDKAEQANAEPAVTEVEVATQGPVFRREGDIWVLGYDGDVRRLRDAKGLAYMARLLAHPGSEVHVADLAGAAETGVSSAGPMLDAKATTQYTARITELDAEILEAEEWSDDARATRARAERDALVEQLTAAYGLGGRARASHDPIERIRKAVTNRIRDALSRIDAELPALGRHLRNSIRTGTYCSYTPEQPTRWEL